MTNQGNRRRWLHYFVGETKDLTARSTLGKKILLFGLVATFLVSLETFVNIASTMFSGDKGFQWRWASLAALVIVLLVLFLLSRFVKSQSSGALAVNPQPHPGCQALILFLSPPDSSFGTFSIERAHLGLTSSSVTADAMLAFYQNSAWLQPLRAIHTHLTRFSSDRLSHVVVIPSKDHPEYETELTKLFSTNNISPEDVSANAALAKAAPTETNRLRFRRGTVRAVGNFRDTALLLGQKLGKNVKIVGGTNIKPRWQDGVDFENALELATIIQESFAYLEKECKVPARDVLIDITSGNALCSAVGAVIALDQNKRFQWVSTSTGEVRPYEIEYVRPDD